jgi:hypothetical protein
VGPTEWGTSGALGMMLGMVGGSREFVTEILKEFTFLWVVGHLYVIPHRKKQESRNVAISKGRLAIEKLDQEGSEKLRYLNSGDFHSSISW